MNENLTKENLNSLASHKDFDKVTDVIVESMQASYKQAANLVDLAIKQMSEDDSGTTYNRKFYISIKPAKDCLFSRRYGYTGKIIKGYSVVVIIFGRTLI